MFPIFHLPRASTLLPFLINTITTTFTTIIEGGQLSIISRCSSFQLYKNLTAPPCRAALLDQSFLQSHKAEALDQILITVVQDERNIFLRVPGESSLGPSKCFAKGNLLSSLLQSHCHFQCLLPSGSFSYSPQTAHLCSRPSLAYPNLRTTSRSQSTLTPSFNSH